MKTAAIYARVSGDRQRQEQTIASQTAALIAFAGSHDYSVPAEWIVEDDGFSGAELVRPGLERIRDLAAGGRSSRSWSIRRIACVGNTSIRCC